MIVAVFGLFARARLDSAQIDHHTLAYFCYDAESLDDAKKDFLSDDLVLKEFADGYGLLRLDALAADVTAIIGACKEAAKATLDVLREAVTKEAGQEGEG